jgi:quinoprotein glucose dehydrogenase
MKKFAPLALGLVLMVSWLWAQNSSPGWGGAVWVWDQPDAHQIAQTNEPRFLRQTFDVKGKVIQAELWITADNHYVVHVNGHKIGEDNEWSTVEKYDVVKHLLPGKNVLAIQVRNQGGMAGVIARLAIKTDDQNEIFVVTNSQMRVTQAASKDWLQTDFDDTKWSTAIVLGEPGIGPWNLVKGSVAKGKGGKAGKSYDVSAADPNIKGRLSAEEQQKYFICPDGFEVELVAADPLVINPVTLTLDENGRIYVSESHTYRYGPPGSPIKPFANPVIRLDPTPDGKGFQRTLIADGFADPVMGMAARDNKLWLTANNFLYQYDLPGQGKAINQKTLAVDKNKAWNPFGMFVVEFGPDGLLYMSVGNHAIDIHGPDGKISGRGGSGIVLRMNPDGNKMERLVHGLRVPYSFDYDPFGQLWLLSNGEGNPNRFVRVIEGIDYHCYSRSSVDNNWLAGNHPLAPPCEELHRGANTQLLRYFGSAYPQSYQGSLFLDNWGAHGFSGPNRGIFRFVPDERGNIIHKEPLLSCSDPHFRPSHIFLDPDGNLLVADWYGRDDESDMTGRIWRLKYKGKDRPAVSHKLDASEWKQDEYALDALGSPHHLIREKAIRTLLAKGPVVVPKLSETAASAPQPMGAVNALWTLLRLDTPETKAAIAAGAGHADWKVRRLALNLLRRYQLPGAGPVAKKLSEDKDPGVRVEAALTLAKAEDIRSALIEALHAGAADDEHLRYEAAWHLGKHADLDSLNRVLSSDKENVRLAGLIALDVACYENMPTKPVALTALAGALENLGKVDHGLLLTVAQLNGDASIIPSLEKLVSRDDLPLATTARAILVLKAKAGGLSKAISAGAGKRLIEAVEKGTLSIATPNDHLVLFEFLESEGPTPFALKQVASQLRSNQATLRQAAHSLARKFGSKGAMLADPLWAGVFSPTAKMEEAIDHLATLVRVEEQPRKENWEKLLASPQPVLRTEAIRWWRTFKGKAEMVDLLARRAPELIKEDGDVREDLATVLQHLEVSPGSVQGLNLPAVSKDKAALTKYALASLAELSATEKQKRALLGQQVFDRSACTKCHTTATQTTPLAPSLKGIAAQKMDYLIESVLEPSKIIKTGFETETVITKDGKVHMGLVKEEGKFLRVLNQDKEIRVAKGDVESRSVSKVSIMPEGQEAQLSRREFVDLIAFLATLK